MCSMTNTNTDCFKRDYKHFNISFRVYYIVYVKRETRKSTVLWSVLSITVLLLL